MCEEFQMPSIMQISVIVPIYNVSRYLRACLDSILNQTYKDLDIILVDDGSTDECPHICDEYSRRDARIRVIHKKNGGLSDARNAGIEYARGRFLTFVDSDDVITADMIEYLHDLLVKYGADMSLCQMRRIDDSGMPVGDGYALTDELIQGGVEACMKAFLKNNKFSTASWSKLYRTSFFQDVRFPKGKWHEDVFTTYKLVAQCQRIIIGGERKYLYRIREGSIMATSFKPAHMDTIEAAKTRNAFIEKNFPSLTNYSRAGVVYAANVCSLRMAQSAGICKSYIRDMQSIYRQYEWSYLRCSDSKLTAKLYSIIAFFNLNILVHFLSYYYHGRK